MSWVLDNIGIVVFIAFAIFSLLRKIGTFLKGQQSETDSRPRSHPMASEDPEEARRVQEIQNEIRRKIAERRGATLPGGRSTGETYGMPPSLPPAQPPPLDPYDDGQTRRMLGEFERRFQPAPAEVQESRRAQAAQLERQEELAEQMRLLEESRVAAERRAEQVRASLRSEAQSERKILAASRISLLAELREPSSLRRAFVLREVLSTPVGLR